MTVSKIVFVEQPRKPTVAPGTAVLYALDNQLYVAYENNQGQQVGDISLSITVASSNASAATRRCANYVCDGIADDVQIQAAIDALPSCGGRVVLSEGKFVISSSLTLPSNFVLEGQGNGTEIELATSSGITYMIQANTKTNITIKNLLIDGTQATNTSVGIYLYRCSYCLVQNVTVTAAQKDGILLAICDNCHVDSCVVTDSGTGEACFDLANCSQVVISNCRAIDSGRNGYEIENECVDITLIGCWAAGAASVGYDVHTHASYGENWRIHFIGCTATDNSVHGFYPSGESETPQYDRQVVFVDCSAYDNGGRQFYLVRQKGARIENCTVFSGSAAVALIDIDSSCLDGITISGNNVERTTAGTYGIYNQSATNSIISGNEVRGCTTHAGIMTTYPAQIIGNRLVGNDDGIYLSGSADRSSVVGNACVDNTGSGIYLNAMTYCTIQGNTCYDDQGTKTQDDGIHEAGASDYNLIVGNVSRAADHQTAGIVTVGANTVEQHNLT